MASIECDRVPVRVAKLADGEANPKYLVEDADLRVQRAQRCLDHQREAVASLERACRDATTAKRLLTI